MLTKTDKNFGLAVPGKLTATAWELPKGLAKDEWLRCGRALQRIEGAVQWWLGDWWIYGHAYGERAEALDDGGPLDGMEFRTLHNYGMVARAVESDRRRSLLSFSHHAEVAALLPKLQDRWLDRAEKNEWSRNELRAAIKQGDAADRTRKVELDAKALGKFAVLYADPPWRYENPPMGGSNRSIENHYPTMDLEEICALPVAQLAHENAVLFLWATSPKLYECMKVLDAWDFVYRTDMVWVKDKIGMGYHVRGQHESILIAKRGELPPPAVDDRPSSVVQAPRLEHSAKPLIFYDLIDRMYPGVRKIELFSRESEGRELWTMWGNQSGSSLNLTSKNKRTSVGQS
jgi:N6-adenosine-specific RNA methylase IME4